MGSEQGLQPCAQDPEGRLRGLMLANQEDCDSERLSTQAKNNHLPLTTQQIKCPPTTSNSPKRLSAVGNTGQKAGSGYAFTSAILPVPFAPQQARTWPTRFSDTQPHRTSRAVKHCGSQHQISSLQMPSLVHCPPLGAEILTQPSNQPNVVLHQVSYERSHEWMQSRSRPSYHGTNGYKNQFPYDHFRAEQAFHLQVLSSSILREIAVSELEIKLKNNMLQQLKIICKRVDPEAQLIPFGSFVNGFATVSSDIDCVFSIEARSPNQEMHGFEDDDISSNAAVKLVEKLRQEGFSASLLSRTRVPIIKLVQKATDELPIELQCDIGFKNHLGIYNTKLLQSYSRYDPRVTDIVLFTKWWAKRRHINSPYKGTLSSYGYVLMILHYLINISNPPILQNLQQLPHPRGVDHDELEVENCDGRYNIWFYKGPLPPSLNNQSLGELIRGFFEYYAYKFAWGSSVISIRTLGGILSKAEKDWVAAVTRPGNDPQTGETWEVKDRFLLAIEDPFEVSHNVARTCTGNGVARIRDELRRAMRLIKTRDSGQSLREGLFLEAERPVFKKEEFRENSDSRQALSNAHINRGVRGENVSP